MSETEERLAFAPPPLTCDTHFHVFGPLDQYPVQSRARYEPQFAPLKDYLELAGRFGIERMVFVQPSAYKTDNSCLLDAMAEIGDAARGIVDISESCPDSEIEDLHRRGVRGVRINTVLTMPYDAAQVAKLTPRVEKLASRLAGLGWCLEFLSPAWLTEALMPTMRKLPMDYIICHMGMFPARDGADQAGFKALLKLCETGKCWVKLTGLYRFSQTPDFADVAPMARALADAAPERLLWGSDHPHVLFPHVSTTRIFNLLSDWFPTERLRQQVLVDNPARLFGFGRSPDKGRR